MSRFAIATVTVALLLTLLATPSSAAVPGLTFTQTGCENNSDSVARLYAAGFDRDAEEAGFKFWLVEYTRGRWNLTRMASHFASSDEFIRTYGQLDQRAFINQLYRNVLNRVADPEGLAFWDAQMNAGMTRGTLLLRFSESPENIARTGTAQPSLGPFNSGQPGPWACSTPPPATYPSGNPGNSKNCGDFRTQAEAQAWFNHYYPAYGDVARLDGDNDRIACEDLP